MSSRAFSAAATAVMLTTLLLPRAVHAAAFVNLFNNFPGSPGNAAGATSTTWLAQPFVPTTSGNADLLSVWAQCTSDGNNCLPGAATMSIYPDNSGKPGATPLVTSEQFQPGRDAPVQGTCLVLPFGPALTAGTPYWAVMKGTTANEQNWIKAGSLTSVNTMRSTDSGATWAVTGTGFQSPFSLRIDDGDHCDPHLVPLPPAGDIVGGMAPRSGNQDVQTITIGNDGIGDLELESYSITGPNASVYRVMTENVKDSPTATTFPQQKTIIPNGLVILYVTCTGPEEEGHFTATLTFTTNDPETPSISWPLSCYVDNTPPTFFVTPNPNGDSGWYKTVPAGIFVRGDDGPNGSGTNFIDCDINGQDFYTNNAAGAAIVPVTVPPAFEGLAEDGSENLIECTGHDVAGNVQETPGTANFKIDSRPPVIDAHFSPPQNAAGWNNTDVDLSFSCADPVPGSGMLTNDVAGGGRYTDETAGTNVTNTGGCRDIAGGVGVAKTVTVKIDKTAPSTEIEGPPSPTNATTAVFELRGTDNLSGIASFICQLDGGTTAPCGSNTPSFPGLADGDHTLNAWAVDAAGNTDPAGESWSWYVDTSPPVVTIDSPEEDALTKASGSVVFHATDVEDVSELTFTCQLDAGTATACTSPYAFSSLTGGAHTVTVTATDLAGNTDSETRQFTVDAVAPTVTVDQGDHQADPTQNSPVRFTAVFSEPVVGFGNSAADVTLTGTAGATTASITPRFGSNFAEYIIEVSGMATDGTVIVSIPANAAADPAGNGNAASTSTDNTVTFIAPNTAPTATNDSYSTNEDTGLTVAAPGVLGNDTDADADALTAVLVAGPANGTLTLNANGSFSYTPAAGYAGPDAFTYRANDGTVNSNVATVNLTVTAVNDVPTATNDGYSTNEDTTLGVLAAGVLGNDTDGDGDGLTAVLVAAPSHGTLTLNADGSFSYTPAANYNGPDSFTYKATDGAADSNVATVSLTVHAVNDAPAATNDSYSTNEDTGLTVAGPGVLGNDIDVDADALTAVLVVGPAHGTLTLNANGSFSYTPAANYNGPDSFTYRANDGTVNSNVATVNLTVTAVNDAPVVLVAPGGSCSSSMLAGTMNLIVSDVDNSAGSLLLSGVSANPNVLPNANITFAGSGSTRSVTLVALFQKRAAVATATATTTITVSDGSANGTTTIAVFIGGIREATINGTTGPDLIIGSKGSNVINGNAGHDVVCGGGGDDLMDGGAGSDTLDGENGNDVLIGGDGDDTLRGSGGDDALTGGAGADGFSGGPGVDAATDYAVADGDTTDGTIP